MNLFKFKLHIEGKFTKENIKNQPLKVEMFMKGETNSLELTEENYIIFCGCLEEIKFRLKEFVV